MVTDAQITELKQQVVDLKSQLDNVAFVQKGYIGIENLAPAIREKILSLTGESLIESEHKHDLLYSKDGNKAAVINEDGEFVAKGGIKTLENIDVAGTGDFGDDIAVAGDVDISDYTTLGGNVGIKTKKLTFTSAASNTSVNVAHGLTAAKILGCLVFIQADVYGTIHQTPPSDSLYGRAYTAEVVGSNIVVDNTDSTYIQSKAGRILIIYEE